MKTQKLLGLLIIVSMMMSSCTKKETGTQKQMTKTYTYSQVLRGSMDVRGTINLDLLTLTEILGDVPASNFDNGEMQIASCYIEIDGIDQLTVPEGVSATLRDFTIQVGSHSEVQLGDCKVDPSLSTEFASEIPQSTNTFIRVVTDLFSDLTSGSKTAQVKVTFNPNVDIVTADNIRLKITVGGTYYYTVFE